MKYLGAMLCVALVALASANDGDSSWMMTIFTYITTLTEERCKSHLLSMGRATPDRTAKCNEMQNTLPGEWSQKHPCSADVYYGIRNIVCGTNLTNGRTDSGTKVTSNGPDDDADGGIEMDTFIEGVTGSFATRLSKSERRKIIALAGEPLLEADGEKTLAPADGQDNKKKALVPESGFAPISLGTTTTIVVCFVFQLVCSGF